MILFYVAIRDPAYGIYYLNGGRRATHSRKLVMNGAWFDYKNTWNRETLTSTGPLRRPLELMVIFDCISCIVIENGNKGPPWS